MLDIKVVMFGTLGYGELIGYKIVIGGAQSPKL